ncbi:MAG: T9SS type A sorting domain-containing protein [Bacteroidia bacterium]
MKKFLLMTAAMATMSGLFAKKVAFVVDMTGQTVGAAGVHVAGNFQGWSPSASVLFPIPGRTGFYGNIFDINAKQVIEFKTINGDNWGPGEESIPAISKVESAANGGSNGNRWMYIDSLSNDTTVINLKFASAAPAGKYAVRFAIDLQKETAVSTDGVHIAGSLQGWDPAKTILTNLFSNNKVYEIIMILDSGAHEYKFLNGKAWGKEEAIPSACAVSNNRKITVTADLAVAKVCFGSCTACPSGVIPTYPVTFKVDMSSSDCDGGFDSVTVTGAGAKLTGFGAGFKMNQVGATGVYQLTVADLDSGEIKFKYRFHKNGNTNWEGGSDRVEVLNAAKTVDLTCFGSRVVGPCPSKPASSKITFIVDFTYAGAPNPAAKVYLIGSFTKPQWQAGAKEMGQVVGKPGVYTVTIDSICPGKLAYKFTNGDATQPVNEENYPDSTSRGCVEPNGVGGFNRTFVRTVATPVTISYQFNKCVTGFTSVSEVAFASQVKLYPNPTNDFSVLAFNDRSNSHNVTILDLAGKVIRTYNNYELATLKIERNELKAGIYFVNVVNSDNQSATMKLMIQE